MNAHRLKLLVSAVAVIALTEAGVLWWTYRPQPLMIPNEKTAGVALLASTQQGAGYFHTASGAADEPNGPWIRFHEVQAQTDRVIRERNFSPQKIEQLQKLIAKLTEDHPSRAVGGERLQLVRLNLALDEIKP